MQVLYVLPLTGIICGLLRLGANITHWFQDLGLVVHARRSPHGITPPNGRLLRDAEIPWFMTQQAGINRFHRSPKPHTPDKPMMMIRSARSPSLLLAYSKNRLSRERFITTDKPLPTGPKNLLEPVTPRTEVRPVLKPPRCMGRE